MLRLVVAQLFRGIRSIGSRRNFSSSPPDIKGVFGTDMTLAQYGAAGYAGCILTGAIILPIYRAYKEKALPERKCEECSKIMAEAE